MNRLSDNAVLKARARRCWRKQRWPSMGAAKAQLRSLLKREHCVDRERLNAYHCPHCGGFHIGRLPEVKP